MAAFTRLDRLARLYGATAGERKSADAALTELYEALVDIGLGTRPGWPPNTPNAIMDAVLAGGSHVVTSFLPDGTRIVERLGPLRMKGTGAQDINWQCPLLFDTLSRDEAFSGGLDAPDTCGVFSTTLPDR